MQLVHQLMNTVVHFVHSINIVNKKLCFIIPRKLDKWSWFLPSFEYKARQRRRGAPRAPRDPLLTKVRSYLPNLPIHEYLPAD